jgi:hypothetical protein
MVKRKNGNLLGSWSFLIGVILAAVFGFLGPLSTYISTILVVLGIVVGLLNIADREVGSFLMAGTVLVIVSSLGQGIVTSVAVFERVLQALTMLFVPATIIVALRSVFSMAKK